MEVELKYARIPRFVPFAKHQWFGIRQFAVHYWLATNDSSGRDRWEVWQRSAAGGQSVGHLHRNLMHPDSSVGGGPTRLEHRWTGEAAERIIETLHRSWTTYPLHDFYRAVPGPNSNTYVAWVLRESRIVHRLSWRAVGSNFYGPF